MIAIDWGTTHLRAYRLNADGSIKSAKASPTGIMSIAGNDFDTPLSEILADWNEAADREILMSGMVGSRQGWIEVPYVPCPAGLGDLAAGLRPAPTGDARRVLICPGIVCRDRNGVPDVTRGEEVQIFGAIAISARSTATICLPGTHSKHALVHDNTITGFTTHMTGEVFAVLRDHSILGRLMAPRRTDLDAFDEGVGRAHQQGGLLHHVFGVRTRMLMNEMDCASLADYLSGSYRP
jgi:2-dehydro-3-deoxygalactonokinase